MSYADQRPRAKRYRPLPLKKLADVTGRADVLVFRLIMHGVENVERRSGVKGLANELRPGLEALVSEFVPARPLFRRRRLC